MGAAGGNTVFAATKDEIMVANSSMHSSANTTLSNTQNSKLQNTKQEPKVQKVKVDFTVLPDSTLKESRSAYANHVNANPSFNVHQNSKPKASRTKVGTELYLNAELNKTCFKHRVISSIDPFADDDPNFKPNSIVAYNLERLQGISVHDPDDPVFDQALELYKQLKMQIIPACSAKAQPSSANSSPNALTTTHKATTSNAAHTFNAATELSEPSDDDDQTGPNSKAQNGDEGPELEEYEVLEEHQSSAIPGSKQAQANDQATPLEPVIEAVDGDTLFAEQASSLHQIQVLTTAQAHTPNLAQNQNQEQTSEHIPDDDSQQQPSARKKGFNPPHRALRYNFVSVQSMEQIMLNGMLSNAIDLLLNAEIECYLGFARYRHVTKDNCQPDMPAPKEPTTSNYSQKNMRNGSYVRNLSTSFGYVSIHYPRDRFCGFSSHIIQKNISQLNISESLLLSLYTCTSNQQFETVITQLCEKRTPVRYIRKLSELVHIVFTKWRKKKLEHNCAFLCLNNLCFTLKPELESVRLPSALEPIQIWQVALGIFPNGKHAILSVNPLTANSSFIASSNYQDALSHAQLTRRYVLPTPLTSSLWRILINELVNRGLYDTSYVCMDGAMEAFEHVLEQFPKTHVMRNLILVEGKSRPVTPPESLVSRSTLARHRNRASTMLVARMGNNIEQLSDLIHSFSD